MGRALGILLSFLVSLLFHTISVSLSYADSADYVYDDNGRLVKVLNANNNRMLYQYDGVGNLLAIIKETSIPQAAAPVLQGISPDVFVAGGTYYITITGKNLLTTQNLTSNNSNITFAGLAAIDTKIIAAMSIDSAAAAGQANLTVTTSYGTATIAANIYRVEITPSSTAVFPGRSINLSVSLNPSASKNLKADIINQYPSVIDLPQSSVTIPAGGSASFAVTGVTSGTGRINVGNAEATIAVIESGASMVAAPVSVMFKASAAGTAVSKSISAEIKAAPAGTVVSAPVSAILKTSTATAVSNPVSAEIKAAPAGTVVSAPVSVKIESN